MNILYVTAYFLPYNSAGTERTLGYINSVRFSKSISLTVLFPLFNNEEFHLKDEANISYIPVRVDYERSSSSFFKRLFVESYTCIKLLRNTIKFSNYRIIVSTPFFPMLFLAPLFCRKSSLILEIRDATWDYFSNSFLRKIIKLAVKITLNRYQKIVTVTSSQLQLLPKEIQKKTYVCENGISKERYNKLQVQVSEKSSINSKNFYYCGTLGTGQNISSIVKFLSQLDDIKIRIRGSGVEFNLIKNFMIENPQNKIELLEYASFNKVIEDYDWADFLIVSLDSRFYSAIPSKLYEYLAAKRKIICFCPPSSAIRTITNNNLFFYDVPNKLSTNDLISIKKLISFKNQNKYNKDLFNKKFIRENSINEFLQKI